MILKAKGINKTYGGSHSFSSTKAIDNVDLEIKEGSFTTIMGPSGSGKTTLLNMLSGLIVPTSGSVVIHEKNINAMGRDELARFRRQHLGFIFQSYNLMEGLNIEENIMLPMILEGKDISVMQEKAKSLMALFLITDIAKKYPQHVSGGQQQRCAIARALINDTSIVFADEPTGNLDSKSAKTVMNAFERANKENKVTIIMVTHDPYTASCSNRVVFIKDGIIQTQINKRDGQKEFFRQIIENLGALEGDHCAL